MSEYPLFHASVFLVETPRNGENPNVFPFDRSKCLRTPPNMLLVNLAVSDMSFSAINGFPLLTISAINKKWVWGKLCKCNCVVIMWNQNSFYPSSNFTSVWGQRWKREVYNIFQIIVVISYVLNIAISSSLSSLLPPLKITLLSGCDIYAFFGGLFGFVSISTLAWVAYDRYVVISNPLEAAMQVTKKRAMGMIAITYALSLFWSLPPFFGWGAYIPEGFQVKMVFVLHHICLIKIDLYNRNQNKSKTEKGGVVLFDALKNIRNFQ